MNSAHASVSPLRYASSTVAAKRTRPRFRRTRSSGRKALAEVSKVLRTCNDLRVPVIAYGAGTSLEGHVSAPRGGISIDMSRMDQVLAVNAEDADCVVQAGVTREALNAYLRDTGLFFPIDPGANATLGGMISTRASGTTTVRYGTIAQNVLALEVVLANGEVIRCGGRARKSSAGYDLVRVFTGAEGTLGIITEATLRLHGQPEAVGSGVCSFPELRGAVEAVIELIQSGAPLARIEFLDEVQIRACNAYSKLSLAEQPTLFIEFNGTDASVAEQFERATEVVRSHGAPGFEWASDEKQRAALWRARHSAYFAALALRPGCECVVADVCVPISKLAECVAAARAEIDATSLIAPIVGHVGDGNFHVLFLLKPGDADERARVESVYDGMIALEANGVPPAQAHAAILAELSAQTRTNFARTAAKVSAHAVKMTPVTVIRSSRGLKNVTEIAEKVHGWNAQSRSTSVFANQAVVIDDATIDELQARLKRLRGEA